MNFKQPNSFHISGVVELESGNFWQSKGLWLAMGLPYDIDLPRKTGKSAGHILSGA